MRLLTILIFYIASVNFSTAQNLLVPDTIIYEKHYVVGYSYEAEGPAYVIYKLWKGGGDVPRKGMTFKKSKLPHFDYYKSGYDKGHLVPAEDFANDSIKMEATFRYYNCLPQTPNLNRGVWKKYENTIREASQTDSLLIFTGGYDFKDGVPKRFFKLVYRLPDGYCMYALTFTNTKPATVSDAYYLRQMYPYYVVRRELETIWADGSLPNSI